MTYWMRFQYAVFVLRSYEISIKMLKFDIKTPNGFNLDR